MTQIERIEKKILCLNMQIDGARKTINELEKMKETMIDNKIIKSKPDVVLLAVSIMSGFSTDQILSKNRKGELVTCRMIVAHRLALAKMGPTAIGKVLNRDHSTVVHLREQFKIDLLRVSMQVYYNQLEGALDKLLITHRN